MSLDKVQSAIVKKVLNLLPPGTPVALENVSFEPPNNQFWAALHFLPNTPEPVTLGEDGRDRANGIAQIDLCYPQGAGGGAARREYERLRVGLPAGTKLAYDGQEVTIRATGRSVGRVSDGWYKVSVTVFWYAYLER